uniref:Uncharacterized protein n=1 Tax=Anguilla anguilla TaxID=7936 RepID=A0A0E9TWM0_ANGAN
MEHINFSEEIEQKHVHAHLQMSENKLLLI